MHLPHEILTSIMQQAANAQHKISPYASVAQSWQAAVENLTFRSLKLEVTDLDTFQEVFRGEKVHRRGHLRYLELKCRFGGTSKAGVRCCKVTTPLDREADSALWSKMLHTLFLILDDTRKRYREIGHMPPAMTLLIPDAGRQRRSQYARLPKVAVRCEEEEHTIREIEAARPPPGIIRLYDSELLPVLTDVTTLHVSLYGASKYISPSCFGDIMSKAPSLRKVEVSCEDPYNWGSIWRRRYQKALSQAFMKLESPVLEAFKLHVYTNDIANEDTPGHQLSTIGHGDHMCDRLLVHLSKFTRITSITLTGPLTVSPTLFETCVRSTEKEIFPALKKFNLDFTAQTSDGRWFFLRDDWRFKSHAESEYSDELEEDDKGWIVYEETHIRQGEISDRNRYRSLPNPETLTPFLVSTAEFCSRIANLETFCVSVDKSGFPVGSRLNYDFVRRVCQLWFSAPGIPVQVHPLFRPPSMARDPEFTHVSRLYLKFGDYTPDYNIIRAWERVVGAEGKITFV